MKNSRKIKFGSQPRLPFEEWDDEPASAPGRPSTRPSGAAGSEFELDAADLRAAKAPSGRLHYISFGSGSSGNSCYVGNDSGGVIIDAGIRADRIADTLRRTGVSG